MAIYSKEEILKAFQKPNLFPHATRHIDCLETHLSWIVLTGEYAYKIKKPVNLGFQDYTSLSKRKYYCELEVELNHRFSKEIYIKTMPIFGSLLDPSFKQQGNLDVIEWIIQMHQFPESAILASKAKEHSLSLTIIKKLARNIAEFHQLAKVCPLHELYGTPAHTLKQVKDNFSALKMLLSNSSILQCFSKNSSILQQINEIEALSLSQHTMLSELINKRKQNGKIKECHGDLHLNNIVLIHDNPIPFDCIEFSEDLRWIDTFNDCAFLAMDLDYCQLGSLGNYFINHYLEHSNDYEGYCLNDYFKAYRGMVRAKVSCFSIEQLIKGKSTEISHYVEEIENHLLLAKQCLTQNHPKLWITYGVSLSGKTTATDKWILQEKGVRLRSDVIRKHLFNLNPFTVTPNTMAEKIYSKEANNRVMQELYQLTSLLLKHNISVCVDATFILKEHRILFRKLAEDLNFPFSILTFPATIDELKERALMRQQSVEKDASDADLDIALQQLKIIEPLDQEELPFAVYPAF